MAAETVGRYRANTTKCQLWGARTVAQYSLEKTSKLNVFQVCCIETVIVKKPVIRGTRQPRFSRTNALFLD